MKQKLVFFFPWHEVSGGPYYLTRLANSIVKTGKYDVYYTDYRYGLSDSLIADPNIKVLEYHDEGKKFSIFPEEPVILVMPIYWAFMVPHMHPNSKIVFFNWHNECIPCLKRDWYLSNRGVAAFLSLVKQTSSVFFCDKAHWMAQSAEGVAFKETYVPIVIPERKTRAVKKLAVEKERKIAIMGRLCIDKVYSVLDVIDNIVALRDQKATTIYLIGDGDQNYRILERTYPSHIKVEGCGTMRMEKIIPMLAKKVDILFAMGTSVLDGASIGLPAVVIPNSMQEFHCNRYPYLYETCGYALGWYPNQIDDMGIETHTIEEIFDDIYIRGKKAEIGERCLNYYRANHTQNVALFQEAIQSSTLTYDRFREFGCPRDFQFAKMLIQKSSFRLRLALGNPYKRLTILGIPVFSIRFRPPQYYNLIICGIPLLRINKTASTFSIHLLFIVWVAKLLKKGLALAFKTKRIYKNKCGRSCDKGKL